MARLLRLRLLLPLIIVFILIYVAYIAYRKYSAYIYDVAHGDLPCFANETTREHLRHMLFAWDTLMTRYNLTYWIDYGTLLGSRRSGRMIPYDYDADACYLWRDLERVGRMVAPALQREFDVYLNEYRPVQMMYRGYRMDLFVYATYLEINREIPMGKSNSTLTRGFYRVSEQFEQKYSDMRMEAILPTARCPFEGRQLSCPNNPNEILKTRYPYTYWLNLKVPFKLKCYLNIFDLLRIIFDGQ